MPRIIQNKQFNTKLFETIGIIAPLFQLYTIFYYYSYSRAVARGLLALKQLISMLWTLKTFISLLNGEHIISLLFFPELIAYNAGNQRAMSK